MDFLSQLCQLSGKKIVLASQSPRRIQLLRDMGLKFEVVPAQIVEEPVNVHDPVDYACQLARMKMEKVWEEVAADLVIAADTIVVLQNKILEKPTSLDDARQMLQQLSGQTHQVISAIALRTHQKEILDYATTQVTFYPLTEHEIELYLQTPEPYDKAGAYGIQGLASVFIEKIEGDYFNVVGFPLSKFYQHLKTLFQVPGSSL